MILEVRGESVYLHKRKPFLHKKNDHGWNEIKIACFFILPLLCVCLVNDGLEANKDLGCYLWSTWTPCGDTGVSKNAWKGGASR